MSASDWSFFSYNLPGSFTEDKGSSVVASGGGSVSLEWSIDAGNHSWIGYMYNGEDIGQFPCNYVSISAAMRNTGNFWGDNGPAGWGVGLCLGFCPNFLSGAVADSSTLDAIVTRYYTSLGRLYPWQCRNASTTTGSLPSGYSYHTIPTVNNSFVQFETMMCMNGMFKDYDVRSDQPGGEGRVWTRWNTGSSLSVPGSAGWTGWNKTWAFNWTSVGASLYQDGYLNGFYPFFGGIASNWTSPTAYANFDYITVRYGTELI